VAFLVQTGGVMAARVWEGAAGLRRSLVPIETLEPFVGNPRVGDVAVLRESLRRFGQVRPVLVDGTQLVAGHHLVRAASEEGWTHVAVSQHTFRDEDERRAYVLTDNRSSDLGSYDEQLLVEQLRALAEMDDGLAGTGYDSGDLDALLASLRELDVAPPVIGADGGQREHRDPSIREVVLLFNPEQFAQIEVWLGIVARESGTEGTSETVFQGMRIAAQQLNG